MWDQCGRRSPHLRVDERDPGPRPKRHVGPYCDGASETRQTVGRAKKCGDLGCEQILFRVADRAGPPGPAPLDVHHMSTHLHLEQLPALILVRHCAVRPLPARVTCQWSCRQQARREISLAGRSAQAWVSGEYPEPEPSALGQNRLRWAGVRDCRERTSCGCAPNDRRMTPVGRQTKLGAAQAMSCCFKRKDSIDAIFAYAACWLVLLQP